MMWCRGRRQPQGRRAKGSPAGGERDGATAAASAAPEGGPPAPAAYKGLVWNPGKGGYELHFKVCDQTIAHGLFAPGEKAEEGARLWDCLMLRLRYKVELNNPASNYSSSNVRDAAKVLKANEEAVRRAVADARYAQPWDKDAWLRWSPGRLSRHVAHSQSDLQDLCPGGSVRS
jgi:hypothetical protein